MQERPKLSQIHESCVTDQEKELLLSNTKTAFAIAKSIVGRDKEVLLYGGVVRNILLGKETSMPDYDFIGDFDPDEIESNYGDLVIGRWDEVTTMRLKIGSAIYDFTWAKDVQERLSIGDITISNLCMTEDGCVIDFFGGMESLKNQEIKMIDADEKIKVNPVRILRAIRFAVELDFSIEDETLNAMIKNAHLLKDASTIEEDLWQIMTLDFEQREKVLNLLDKYGFDRYLNYPDDIYGNVNILDVEKSIGRIPQVEKVAQMFVGETYLVGGAVKDIIWGKNFKDLDFKVNMPVGTIIEILDANGYRKVDTYKTNEGEYYVSLFAGVVGVMIDGIDIHVSSVNTADINELISEGDLNFSCCVYNAHSKRVENPVKIKEIQDKILLFANPDKAITDPLIIINALKQISRIPDIVVPETTKSIIMDAIPRIATFIKENPQFKYKLKSLGGNLNSEEVYCLFTEEYAYLLDGIDSKKDKLIVTDAKYQSLTIDELSQDQINQINGLIKTAFNKHYDETKFSMRNFNSVVIEVDDKTKIASCCLVDGERLYTAAARNSKNWSDLIAHIAKSNYNVWCTVDSGNPKIQALCSVAGLKIETNEKVIRKILDAKSDKYKGMNVKVIDGLTTFTKGNSTNDYPQILLRS